MFEAEHPIDFAALTQSLEAELEGWRAAERSMAFVAESRPVPEGLIPNGLPLGHIAFKGDFDQKNEQQQGEAPSA